jgi:hypothetical protein
LRPDLRRSAVRGYVTADGDVSVEDVDEDEEML